MVYAFMAAFHYRSCATYRFIVCGRLETQTEGGEKTMMRYNGWNDGPAGRGELGLVVTVFWILIFVNLVLLAVFLWKKITHMK